MHHQGSFARGVRTEVRHDRFRTGVTETPLSPAVRAIVLHICQEEHRAFGAVLEWCETRGDCQQAILCPVCAAQFLVDEDELAELRRWTEADGASLSCGVRWE